MYRSIFSIFSMEASTLVFVCGIFTLCIARPFLLPCPNWDDDAVFVNGKCYKIVPAGQNDFTKALENDLPRMILMRMQRGMDSKPDAQKSTFMKAILSQLTPEPNWEEPFLKALQRTCSRQSENTTLGEPRTRDEFDILLTKEFLKDRSAFMGVYKPTLDANYTHMSNGKIFDALDRGEIWTCENPPCCMRLSNYSHRFSDEDCIEWYTYPYNLCQRDSWEIYERYVVSVPKGKITQLDDVILELVTLHPERLETPALLGKHGSFNNSISEYFYTKLNFTSAVYEKSLLELLHYNRGFIQLDSLEIIGFEPLAVTLMYKGDNHLIRTLLYPLFSWQSPDLDDGSYFMLVSSGRNICNEIRIVAMQPGPTRIAISFNASSSFDVHDSSVRQENVSFDFPKYFTATIQQFQHLMFYGKMFLDGTIIESSKEVAVFMIVYKENSYLNEVVSVQQALPFYVAALEYITVPFEPGSDSIYKLSMEYSYTEITYNGVTSNSRDEGSLEIVVPSDDSYLVTGNKPFQVHKVLSGNTKDGCYSPLIPRMLWRREYVVPYDWIRQSPLPVTLHFICDDQTSHKIFLGSFPLTGFRCKDVKGAEQMKSCKMEQLPTIQNDVAKLSTQERSFAAYLSWVQNNVLFCQPLGHGDTWTHWEPSNETFDNAPEETTTLITTTTDSPTTTASPTTTIAETTTVTTPTETTSTEAATSSQTDTTALTTTASSSTRDINTPTVAVTHGLQTTPVNPSVANSIPTTTVSGGPNANISDLACQLANTKRTNLTLEELESILTKIRQKLLLDTTKLSAFIRKKTSIVDKRPSSTGIGSMGLVFFGAVFGSILILDLMSLGQVLENRNKPKVEKGKKNSKQ